MKTNFQTKHVTEMTRAQGEKAVAATTDLAELKRLGDHRNSHVRAKAAYKYGRLTNAAPPAVTGEASRSAPQVGLGGEQPVGVRGQS